MHSALYYPGWGIADPGFMFESLLYWDRLACMVPYDGFKPQADWPDGFEQEAEALHERFVTGIEPSEEVKAATHERLATLLDTEPPEWCRAENLAPDDASVLAVRKVSSQTINMLTEHGWLASQRDDSHVLISRAAAGIVLCTLAREIASETMPALTDNPRVFKASCNGLLRELQSRNGISNSRSGEFYGVGSTDEATSAELAIVLTRIVKFGIEEANVTPQMLRRLSALREDSGFNEQREQFCGQVDRYIADLRTCPVMEHKVLHDHWEQKLKADRRTLKRELRSAGLKSIVEKEGVVATGVGAVVGMGTLAAAGPIGLVIGIGIAGAGTLASIRKRRAEVVEKHWTSWLVAAARPGPVGFAR